ncbi:nitronate monooxygenase [Rosenbergiella epipactidis]|uniref:nitronate monooxygenase n=1 Tax=Rosenbergiella epipactidis TaxID=1544694 RepID=UPI00240E7FC0|nr:nitronate monooxygenase [Rosenbergiella epipactidis]
MAGVSPLLASQVSEAGGHGALGLGACDAFQAERAIRATQQLTSQPFQVNLFCHRSRRWTRLKVGHGASTFQSILRNLDRLFLDNFSPLMPPLLTRLSYSRLSLLPAQRSSVFTLV